MANEFKRLLLNLLMVSTEETGAMRRAGFAMHIHKFQKDNPDMETERVKALEVVMYDEPVKIDQLCHEYLGF